jgi:hypothetical protein
MATETNNSQAQNNSEQNNNDQVKVTFDERQQARVNELIREKQGEAAREIRAQNAELQRQMAEMQAQLAEATKSQRKNPTAEGAEDIEALKNVISEMKSVTAQRDQELDRYKQQLSAKASEVEKTRQEMVNIRRGMAIRDAASKANFVDLNAVSKLTEDSVKWDDSKGRFLVVNPETGTERMNAAFEPMSLDEFYTEYAARNPYLVRGEARGGAGSYENQRNGASMVGRYEVESVFGPKGNALIAAKLFKSDPDEYKRLRKVAVEKGWLSK